MKSPFYLFAVLSFLLLPISIFAQKIYHLDSVSHLKLYDNSLYLMSELSGYYYDWRLSNKEDVYFKDIRNPKTSENVVDKYSVLFSVDSIQSNSVNDVIQLLLHKEFIVWQKDSSILHTLCMISPNLFYSRYYRYEYNSSMTVQGQDKSSWQITNAQILPFDYIELANRKTILQGYGNNYIIPTTNGLLFGFDKRTIAKQCINIIDTMPASGRNVLAMNREVSVLQTASNFSNYDVKIMKNKNQKYELQTYHGLSLLVGQFDTIIKDKYFFATKSGNYFSLYNWVFNKIEDSVRAFNFYDYYVQIIKENKLSTLGVLGKIDNYYVNNLMGCGTVPHFKYTIQKKNKQFSIVSLVNGPGAYNPDNRSDIISFKNNLQFESMTFLDGTTQINYTSNTGMGEDFEITRDWLLVKKGSKYGVICFDKYEKDLDEKIILPIEYDSIVCNKNFNEPLKVYKFGLCGLFPLDYSWNRLNAKYDYKNYLSRLYVSLDKRSKYFVRYQKIDGEKGWLDLIMNKDISDEK